VSALPWLLFAALLVSFAVAGVLGYQKDKKRRAALQGYAASNGWSYTASDVSWCVRFSGTPFDTGDNLKARNILQGSWNAMPMVAFDYSYETHSTDDKGGRSTTVHRFAICALQLRAPLPMLQLTPESLLSRVADALGATDIELESEDFNRRYRVKARDPKFAYDVLNPRTMQALMSLPAQNLRLLDVDAITWAPGRLAPVDLPARLSTLKLLVDGIPSFVWADHTEGEPRT
jgi:Protein of unknown function (DUF3137)